MKGKPNKRSPKAGRRQGITADELTYRRAFAMSCKAQGMTQEEIISSVRRKFEYDDDEYSRSTLNRDIKAFIRTQRKFRYTPEREAEILASFDEAVRIAFERMRSFGATPGDMGQLIAALRARGVAEQVGGFKNRFEIQGRFERVDALPANLTDEELHAIMDEGRRALEANFDGEPPIKGNGRSNGPLDA